LVGALVNAHDLFLKSLSHLRYSGAGWLSDFIFLWLDPEEYPVCWFSGENDKIRVWEFRMVEVDALKFKEAVPEAVLKTTQEIRGFTCMTYKVTVDKM
jgi:hypothetical protein